MYENKLLEIKRADEEKIKINTLESVKNKAVSLRPEELVT